MIRKKEWEKSFKNVNGREPNEEDYEKGSFTRLGTRGV